MTRAAHRHAALVTATTLGTQCRGLDGWLTIKSLDMTITMTITITNTMTSTMTKTMTKTMKKTITIQQSCAKVQSRAEFETLPP